MATFTLTITTPQVQQGNYPDNIAIAEIMRMTANTVERQAPVSASFTQSSRFYPTVTRASWTYA